MVGSVSHPFPHEKISKKEKQKSTLEFHFEMFLRFSIFDFEALIAAPFET